MTTTPVPAAPERAAGDPRDRLEGAVPTPSFAFLLTLITLAVLFWLVTFKRTTGFTLPEQWLLNEVAAPARQTVLESVPVVDSILLAVSALGSGWFVSLGFAALGIAMIGIRRRDLAWMVALGTLAFPIEWALKYFTAIPVIRVEELLAALLNVGGVGLDDIADFPAGHALRATVFYGMSAFIVARLTARHGPGILAYALAMSLIVSISAIRIYLGAHFPIDVLGGWTAGMALLTVAVSWHVLQVDERVRVGEREERLAQRQDMLEQLRRRREGTAHGTPERPTPRARPRPPARRPVAPPTVTHPPVAQPPAGEA